MRLTFYSQYSKKALGISAMLLIAVSSVGCSTTSEFRPTASVMAGATTSL